MALCPCPLLVVPLPVVLLLLLAVPSSGADGDSLEEPSQNEFIAKFEREEREYYESLGQKGQQEDKCNVHYNPENGKCAWWNNEEKKYERPALDHDNLDGLNCLPELHNRIFTHVCGDPLYEQLKYCAKVKFFNNMEPKGGEITEENVLLLLLDGCILCIGDNEKTAQRVVSAKLRLSYTLPAGSFFTGCSEETVEIDLFSTSFPYNASITNGTIARSKRPKTTDDEVIFDSMVAQSAFVFPTPLAERRCVGLFSEDEPRGGFRDVTLTVEHNCNSDKPNRPIVHPLSEWLQTADFKHNVAELRRLHIDLGEGRVAQFSALNGKCELSSPMQFDNLAHPPEEDKVF